MTSERDSLFYNEEPVFKPSSFVKPLKDCPETAFITWHSGVAKVAKSFGAKKIYLFYGGIPQEVYSISYKGKKFVFAQISQGCPNAAAFIEELKVLGVRKFLFIGCCGVLDKSIGSYLIVPTRALRDEGTSAHYTDSKSEFIEIKSCERLVNFFEGNKIPYRKGCTWTTDAVFRETPSAIKNALEKGCICVEMECAGVMAVSEYLGLECYQFLFSADILSETEWNCGTLLKDKADSNSMYTTIALEFCLTL